MGRASDIDYSGWAKINYQKVLSTCCVWGTLVGARWWGNHQNACPLEACILGAAYYSLALNHEYHLNNNSKYPIKTNISDKKKRLWPIKYKRQFNSEILQWWYLVVNIWVILVIPYYECFLWFFTTFLCFFYIFFNSHVLLLYWKQLKDKGDTQEAPYLAWKV